MDATQAAAEAATNGVKAAKTGFTNPLPLGKAVELATDVSVGFFGLAVSGWGASVAVASFKHALTVAKNR